MLLEFVPRGVHGLLIQEHKLFVDRLPTWQRKLAGLGWKAYLSPAITGPNGGASGGSGILLRPSLESWGVGPRDLIPGRATQAALRVRDWGELRLVSVYCDVYGGVQGNAPHFPTLGGSWRGHGVPTLWGGDFQLPPEVVQAAFAGGVLGTVHFGQAADTCRRASSASVKDYFVTASKAQQLVLDVVAIEGAPVATHVPVELVCVAGGGWGCAGAGCQAPAASPRGPTHRPSSPAAGCLAPPCGDTAARPP